MKYVILIFLIGSVFITGCITQEIPEEGDGLEFPDDFDIQNETNGEASNNETVEDNSENDNQNGEPQGNETIDNQEQYPELSSCGSENELFSTSFISLDEINYISPLGSLNPPGHTFPTRHIYIHLKESAGDLEENVEVYAPADMLITSISSYEQTPKTHSDDYSIRFSVCGEFEGYFIHIKNISEKLKKEFVEPYSWCSEYGTGGIEYSYCEKELFIHVEAGEVLGTVKTGGVFDLGTSDYRTPELDYVNKDVWGNDLYVVCPLDHFESEVREELKGLLGNSYSKRTVEPVCGEVEQDEPGTAQGIWFNKEEPVPYPEDPHLALVHDNTDPSLGVFSVGTSTSSSELYSGKYYFDPEDSGFVNRDFDQVTSDGNVYCYETYEIYNNEEINVVINIQLKDSETLWIERVDGQECVGEPQGFSSSYSEFER